MWLFLAQLLAGVALGFEGDSLHRRFEYKHSFKGPNLIDGAGKIPFWQQGGSCMPATDNVRVTPSIRSKQGWVWNKLQYVGINWELDISLRVHGRGKIGADGMALWYVTDLPADIANSKGGSVYGAVNNWRGLGIFFDSFDNDNKHDNPIVIGVVNDGTMAYNHGKDGVGQSMGSCVKDFRNRPHSTRVRIRYYENTLALDINVGMTNRDADFEPCFKVDNVKLPPGGHFGVSAATGALADDHDISSFLTYSLYTKKEEAKPLTDDAKARILEDYEKYDTDLEAKKRAFAESHPDRMTPANEDEQNLFYKSLIDYQVKLSEKFEMLQQAVKAGASGGVAGGAAGAAGGAAGDSVMRSTVINIEKQQTNVLHLLETAGSKMDSIIKEVGALQTKTVTSDKDIRNIVLALASTQEKLKVLSLRKQPACPSVSGGGVTVVHLLCALILQTSVLLGYWLYRHRLEDARKKFF